MKVPSERPSCAQLLADCAGGAAPPAGLLPALAKRAAGGAVASTGALPLVVTEHASETKTRGGGLGIAAATSIIDEIAGALLGWRARARGALGRRRRVRPEPRPD